MELLYVAGASVDAGLSSMASMCEFGIEHWSSINKGNFFTNCDPRLAMDLSALWG